MTYLFGGATAHAWLPPDSLRPEGRLVLVSSESKRREHAYAVDARRRAEAAAPATAPEAYAAWTRHRPPREVPAHVAPNPALVRARYAYRPWRNVTHALTLALPYYDNPRDFGLFGTTLWLEPLGKHVLLGLLSVSLPDPLGKTIGLLSYTNNELPPSLTLNLYRYPSPARWYGSTLLVEDLAGGDLTASLPLDLTDAPFVATAAEARLRLAHARPFDQAALADVEATTPLAAPEAGVRAEVRLGFSAKRQRPYRFNDLYPLDGTGLRLRLTAGLPALGSRARFLRPDLQAYWVSPEIGLGRLYLYGRAQAQLGRTLAQDYLGLSRYDDLDLQLPMLEPITLSDTERVRGYRRYALGSRLLFATAEFRLPPVFDLQTRLLGFLEFDRIVPTLFLDAAMVWSGGDLDGAIRRTGVGFEIKNRVRLGGFPLVHAVGVAQRWRDVGERLEWDRLDLHYRIQASLPF